MLDLKKLFPSSKFPTAEELKAKEDTFSIGDRVKVADNIRCRQHGQIGTIIRIEPEDKYNWKSFIVKFDDEKYNPMGFNSGSIDKINEKRNTMMKKINESQKVTLTFEQLKRLAKESLDGDFAKILCSACRSIKYAGMDLSNYFDDWYRAEKAGDEEEAMRLLKEVKWAVKKSAAKVLRRGMMVNTFIASI